MAVPYWRLSGFYFFYFATLGAFLPYWNLYLKNVGFSAAEVGELSALLAASRIVAPALWGWAADASGRGLGVIRLTSGLALLVFSAFTTARGYVEFALLTFVFSFFWNAGLPQFEAATLFHLGRQTHRYSRIRLWGSIGFIGAVIAIGGALGQFDIALLPFPVMALLAGIWLTSLLTPEIPAPAKPQPRIALTAILKKSGVLAFMGICVLLQTAHGAYYYFYSLYLQQQHYSPELIGLLWALGVAAEIAMFMVLPAFLKKNLMRRILLMSIAAAAIRWLLIAWSGQCALCLVAAQFLHAATFGSTHAVSIHLVHEYFGSRLQGTGQALYSSFGFGLGGVAGSLYSGYFWDLTGPRAVFTLAAVLCLAAFLIAYIWVGRENDTLPLKQA